MSSDFEHDDDDSHQEHEAQDASEENTSVFSDDGSSEEGASLGGTFSEAKGATPNATSSKVFERSVWSKSLTRLHDSVRPKTPEAHGSASEREELDAQSEHAAQVVGYEVGDAFGTQGIEPSGARDKGRVEEGAGARRGELVEVLDPQSSEGEGDLDHTFSIPAEFEDAPTPGDGSSFEARVGPRVLLDSHEEEEDIPLRSFRGGVDDELMKPAYYINRELSWLEFNQRVLWQAKEPETPLLERVKFLCISSTNLDEFFEIRVGRLKQQLRMNSPRIGPDGMTPQDQLDRIYALTQSFVAEQYRVLNEELIPELAKQGIRFLRRSTWNDAQAKWVAEYFQAEVLPVLSPLGLDPAHPFPRVLNKSLNFIVSLEGQDAFGRSSGLAVVQAPRALGRLIQIPQEVSGGVYDFVFLSSIIHAHVGELFPGMRPKGCYQFRATRNSELFVDEEEVEDLMLAMEEELYQRHYGDAVRLEVADNCPMEAARYLLKQFGLTERELFQVRGPVNLGRLMMIPGAIDRPDLKDEPFVQRTVHVEWPRKQDIFAQLRMGDVLLHHPFESFSTVIEFFKQASEDPNVLAIKQTVYRTEEDSVLVDSLVNAARAGKEVTAVIELRARFDEERNIHIANRLQEAGAHVVYGVVGYKTHAKMALVVRREAGALKRYVHLGTGNYHPRTARLYTDFGLMTYDQEIGEDVHNMFQQLTGLGRVMEMHHLLHSPFTLHSAILDKIERETQLAAAGKRGHIMAKINSLTEPEVVRALYRASRAGVRIDLIIRGICRLRPGHKGLSESIRVRSIVGRFLEHTRCFYFRNGGREEVWCASADWMSRNLLRRVETCFPILAPRLRERVIHEQFQVYLRDNTKAWELNEDGSYTRLAPPSEALAFSAQDALLEELAAES